MQTGMKSAGFAVVVSGIQNAAMQHDEIELAASCDLPQGRLAASHLENQ